LLARTTLPGAALAAWLTARANLVPADELVDHVGARVVVRRRNEAQERRRPGVDVPEEEGCAAEGDPRHGQARRRFDRDHASSA
jgi:hypothetical protein